VGKNPFQNFVVRFEPGQRIYDEGDIGATMYIVQTGRVQLFRESKGDRRVLGEMEKGDFFGEMSILEGLPRNSVAEAVEPADLIEISSSTFDKMIKGNIEIAVRLLRKLSIRLRESERQLDELRVAGTAAAVQIAATPASSPAVSVTTGIRLVTEDETIAFALKQDETLIGRFDPVTELTPDVDLTECDLKRSVSRRHARVVRTDDGYALVEEVGALNGTFVKGEKLEPGHPHPIADGDSLAVGMVQLVFRT